MNTPLLGGCAEEATAIAAWTAGHQSALARGSVSFTGRAQTRPLAESRQLWRLQRSCSILGLDSFDGGLDGRGVTPHERASPHAGVRRSSLWQSCNYAAKTQRSAGRCCRAIAQCPAGVELWVGKSRATKAGRPRKSCECGPVYSSG